MVKVSCGNLCSACLRPLTRLHGFPRLSNIR
ncbi:hypothetical protein QX239_06835 [Vibrio parahaemolyticus]|nr:hypothetical protein [Vibrio parahaemolyticus]